MPIGPFAHNTPAPSYQPPNKYASRKFVLALSTTALSTILLSRKRITNDNWIEINKWVCCSYLATNALSGITIKPAIWNR